MAAAGLLGAAALGLAADAGTIHAKAWLAQRLLEHSWANQRDGAAAPPWPGADTHAVARLRQRDLGIAQIVLAGDSGRSLAFGPGWAPASAAPGSRGTTVISGHRDTHFDWLQRLPIGAVLELEAAGRLRRYRVAATRVADAGRDRLALDDDRDRLLLVTCWPFDAVRAGGSGRYVVEAQACDADCGEPGHSAQAAAPGAA